MCENHDYCYVQMPNNESKILEYKHSQKPKRAPFVIYSDLECLLQKTNEEEEYKIIKIKKFAIYATKNLVLMMKMKIITKLKIIVNVLISTKVLAIKFVDQNVNH